MSPNLTTSLLTRQAFARRLFTLMIGKGWLPSELARRARLPEEATFDYLHGTVLPTQTRAKKLAKALEVTPEVLLPSNVVAAFEAPTASVEARLDNLVQRIEALEGKLRKLCDRQEERGEQSDG